MSRNMCAAAVRPDSVRRPEMHSAAACPEAYSAAVPAKATVPAATVSAAMSAKACAVSATMSPATAAAGVCFEREERHDDEYHRGHASAGREHELHGAAELGAPRCCGRLSLGLAILPRTKSF